MLPEVGDTGIRVWLMNIDEFEGLDGGVPPVTSKPWAAMLKGT